MRTIRVSTAFALATLFSFATNAVAQADTPRPCDPPPRAPPERLQLISLQVENDLFAGTDSQYTNGVKLTWVSPNIGGLNDPLLPTWIRCSSDAVKRVFNWFLPVDASARNVVVTLGQAMYTPSDRARVTLDEKDRPYAGWAYLGLGYNVRLDPPKASMPTLNTVEIDIGIVGPHSYAKQTQDFVHRLRRFERFLGWDNQLHDEPGLQIVWEQKFRPATLEWRGLLDAQIIPHYGLSVGNIASYVNLGAEARIGWHLPDDFGTSLIRPGGDNAAPRAIASMEHVYGQQSAHFFISLDGRAVANNIFLDGNTFARSHAVKKKPFVGDIAYGWAYTWPRSSFFPTGKIAYAHYMQSREFEGEEHNHGFGSVTLSIEF